ncbi:MAG: MFS transporter [Methanosarcinaceae archaeon]|nr:MFS transporter [Methanosarcinaceae archaeon]
MKLDRVLIYLSVFVIMGLSNAVIPILPELVNAGQTPYDATHSSMLFSSYFLGALITMLPFGILSDRYGYVRFITFGLFLTLVSGVLLLTASNLWVLIVARFVEGSACGAFFPAAYSLLSESPKKKQYMGEFNFLLNGGLASGVVLTGFLADTSIRYGILIFTTISSVVLLFAIYLSRETAKTPDRIQKDTLVEIVDNVKESYWTLTYRPLTRIWIIVFVLFGVNGVLLSLYPDYSLGTLTKSELGLSISIMYISTMAASILIARTSLEHNTMIKMGIILGALGALIAIWFAPVGFALLGIGSGFAMVGLPIAVSCANTNRGLAMGMYSTCTYGGLALVPIAAGIIVIQMGFEWVFVLNGLALGLMLLLKEG